MSKRVIVSLLVIVTSGLVDSHWLRSSQQPDPRKRQEVLAQLQEDISYLAKEPRFSGPQFDRAAAYVSSQAQKAGFEAVRELVAVSPWERGAEDRCDLLLPGGKTKQLDMVALTGSEAGELEGEVVLVNYFFDKNQGPPPRRFDEGNKKRIIVVSRPLKRDRSIKGYEEAVVQRNDAAIWGARYGAKAVLVRSVQTGDGPPHTGAVNYSKDVPKIPAVVLSVGAADELESLLCPGNGSKDPANSQPCNGHAAVRLKVGSNHPSPSRQQANVIIRIPGTALTKEIVLVAAHLDSHDTTPGAADDAAGVAAVLAVMREFARNPPRRTILLIFYADEELNGSGALVFVDRHKEELSSIAAAIEIDDGDGPPRALQITSSESQRQDALLTLRHIADSVGAEANGLELHADTEVNGADIEPLWKDYGIPEVAIKQDFANYFDKHHARNDTPENVDFVGLGKTTFLLIRVVQVLSSGEITPPHRPGPLLTKISCTDHPIRLEVKIGNLETEVNGDDRNQQCS